MKSYFNFFEKVRNQAGVSAVIVAIVLTMLIGFTALAVDVGYMYVTKNELQNVADAAALAGAGHLGSIYKTLSYDDQQTHVFSRSDIVGVTQQVALKNQAAKMNIVINDADVTIGAWDGGTGTLTPMAAPIVGPDAVKVIARRDSIANGPILTFFARILNINTVNVSADATAALTGPATAGDLRIPFSLSENNFPNDCTNPITFSPTTESCAGWHNFLDPANAATMPDKMLGLIQGDVQEYEGLVSGPAWLAANFDMNAPPDAEVTPEVGLGDEFIHQGGTVASLFLGGRLDTTSVDLDTGGPIMGDAKHPAPFPALFDYFRRRDGDGNDSIWTATVPVYEDDDVCENPSGAIPIIGFATIEIHMPNPPPDSSVSVNVYCDISFIDGRGGGGAYGNLKGTIPNLVE
ncbi:MAG: hypothetical protein JRD93_18865 [Deltaproteobacteria bacterium]|nr:hypothetical protein [Deltaproteobacteria bacterium]MBW2663978.1 hypothetical protein [Deltaproteobacteria bacterium]